MEFDGNSREDFSNYVRQYVAKESQKEMKDPLGQFLTSILGGLAGGVVSSQTVRTDCVLFSVYEVQFGKERFKALGILKNFILLRKPDLERIKTGGGSGG